MKQKKCINQLYLLLVLSTLPLFSWGKTEGLQRQIKEVIGCLVDSRLVEADSLASLINDDDILQLDSLQKTCYYIKGLAKYSVEDASKAIYYFEKARELYLKEGLFDNNFLNMTLFLCDCYARQGEIKTIESYLRKAIIRYVDQFETNPSDAAELYSLLAKVYEAKGDTLWSDRVHVEKIQYYLIKDYLQNNHTDESRKTLLEEFKDDRYIDDQYNYPQGFFDNYYIMRIKRRGERMEEIGCIYEAKWCYLYCIRQSSKYLDNHHSFVMDAYVRYLDLSVKNNNIDDFNALFPQAVEYAKGGCFNAQYNEFVLAKIYGDTFSEMGNKEQAYNCYRKCIAFLDAGNIIEDEKKNRVNIYISLMAICDDLGHYQEALSYQPFLENMLTKSDGEKYYNYKYNLFLALIGIMDYEKSLPVIEELVQMKIRQHDTLSQQYIEVCLLKGANLILLNKDIEAISTFNSLYDCLQNHSTDIADLQGNVYSYLASWLMELGEYQKALIMFEKSAEIEQKEYGHISDSTRNDINKCKKQL